MTERGPNHLARLVLYNVVALAVFLGGGFVADQLPGKPLDQFARAFPRLSTAWVFAQLLGGFFVAGLLHFYPRRLSKPKLLGLCAINAWISIGLTIIGFAGAIAFDLISVN